MRHFVRRALVAIVGLVAAAGITTVIAQPAAASTPVHLVNHQNYGCLTADVVTEGAVYVSGCTNAWNQQWQVVSAGGKYYYIKPYYNTSLCLDVQWASPDDGAPLWLWPCNQGRAQIFAETFIGNGWMWLVTQTSFDTKCLDKAFWGNVVQWTCHDTMDAWWQQWRVET